MTPADQNEVRSSLLMFTQFMFLARKGQHMKGNWHIDAVCEALERVVLGYTKRLIINIPPRSGKTEIAVKMFMAWCVGNFPDSQFIHASYSKTLAASNTAETREIIRHEAWRDVFGDPDLRADTNAKDHFKTRSGGHVYATGTEGSITGFGAGLMRDTFGGAIIIDDP